MSSLWTRTWKSTPKVDCGLCGYPNCASFGRALMYDMTTLETCPLFQLIDYTNLRAELESIKKRVPHPRSKLAPEQPEGGVLLTKPCKDTNERVMAELRVFNGVSVGEPILFGVFDPMILCILLNCLASEFELVKCSKDLGYGRADTGELSITVLQDGRINMRRVLNKEQVLALFDKLEKAIIGSSICNSCGRDLLSILLNGDLSDGEEKHTILDGGSLMVIDNDQVGSPLLSKDVSENLGDEASTVIEMIETLSVNLKKNVLSLTTDESLVINPVSIDEIRCALVTLITSQTQRSNGTLILKVLSLLFKLESAFIGIDELAHSIEIMPDDDLQWTSDKMLRIINREPIGDIPSIEQPRLVVAYAQIKRIANALKYLDKWES